MLEKREKREKRDILKKESLFTLMFARCSQRKGKKERWIKCGSGRIGVTDKRMYYCLSTVYPLKM